MNDEGLLVTDFTTDPKEILCCMIMNSIRN